MDKIIYKLNLKIKMPPFPHILIYFILYKIPITKLYSHSNWFDKSINIKKVSPINLYHYYLWKLVLRILIDIFLLIINIFKMFGGGGGGGGGYN